MEGPEYDGIGKGSPIFSQDSKRVAYSAKKGDKWLVVVGGQAGPEYDSIAGLIFSPDGNRVAYGANRSDKCLVVVDGIEQKEYDSINLLTFSPDSKHIAFCANVGSKSVTLEEDDYEILNEPVFEHGSFMSYKKTKFPNAKGLKKIEQAAGKLLVVIDGDEGRKYDVVANLDFSPDSKRYVYWGHNGKEWIIIVNGIKGGKYEGLISGPMQRRFDNRLEYYLAGKLISYPDSKFVFDTPTTFHTLAHRDGKIFRVEVEVLATH
jgi:WD40 repeat protein